jgi:hypothetical protein
MPTTLLSSIEFPCSLRDSLDPFPVFRILSSYKALLIYPICPIPSGGSASSNTIRFFLNVSTSIFSLLERSMCKFSELVELQVSSYKSTKDTCHIWSFILNIQMILLVDLVIDFSHWMIMSRYDQLYIYVAR